jgi:site-specific DNA-cytosine methylase
MKMSKAVLRKVRTDYGKAIRKAYESGQIYERRSNMTRLEPRLDGLSNTLTTVQKDNYVLEIKGDDEMRIRKLTPKECFRLMGFDDESFHRAEAVNSNAQLYKQAGNSIVVDVLEELFCMMLDENGEIYV